MPFDPQVGPNEEHIILEEVPTVQEPLQWVSENDLKQQGHEAAIKALKKKINSTKSRLQGQNLSRHQAVLAFLCIQQKKQAGETRRQLAFFVARCFNRGWYFARKIVTWELSWVQERIIDEGRRGCFAKVRSWLNDEGVELAVREWISGAGERITVHGLAKVVGDYVQSRWVTEVIGAVLGTAMHDSGIEEEGGRLGRVRARIAWRWLNKMGFTYGEVRKSVYVDGHERADVVEYRKEVFLPLWDSLVLRMVEFKEDGSWSIPESLPLGEKPLVFITHDESTFNANDGKRRTWKEDGKQPLRAKSRGKGIMVSGFLTPGGRLKVPDTISNEELLLDPMWPKRGGIPIRDAMEYLEYGKNNYWMGDKMVHHTMQIALPIFQIAFPGCQALFAFDNASNHSCYASDALLACKMNRGPGGSQPLMRDGFIHSKQRPQAMVYSQNHPNFLLQGKAKGLEQVLKERGLWKKRRPDGFPFLLECPTSNNRSGCDPNILGGCCGRVVLAAERDFLEQNGRLQEELEASGQRVIFYPKFHCELNFIERFWCSAKYYTRENCQYSLEGLRETIPQALDSVSSATIHRYFLACMRILDAYRSGLHYGTAEFRERVYKSHRRVEDKTKW
ncbi:hypothetical protein L873DRAFT_1767021 [Choiromyces venosus 120613-1]|uniref:Tc1-like transposase DDE domain-containing protein n=1 Tax=Choiromyces venosus 120613-1 TaxID=1336337 RepID=A0A3N4JR14_9PEZI|nr:hypothetical protein L873DRAFT_1767021 [Choiromyces venosus 120613-1]